MGSLDAAVKRVVLRAQGWMSYLVTPSRVALNIRKIKEIAGQADQNPDGSAQSFPHFLCVEDSRKKARAKALDYLNRTHRQSFDKLVDTYASGGPADV